MKTFFASVLMLGTACGAGAPEPATLKTGPAVDTEGRAQLLQTRAATCVPTPSVHPIKALNAIWAGNFDDIWVASGTHLVHWNSQSWTSWDVSEFGVSGFPRAAIQGKRDALYAIASPGIVLQWDGQSWRKLHEREGATFEQLKVLPDGRIWVAARSEGAVWIERFENGEWTSSANGVPALDTASAGTTSRTSVAALWMSEAGAPVLSGLREFHYRGVGPLQELWTLELTESGWEHAQPPATPGERKPASSERPFGFVHSLYGMPDLMLRWDGWRWQSEAAQLLTNGDSYLFASPGRIAVKDHFEFQALGYTLSRSDSKQTYGVVKNEEKSGPLHLQLAADEPFVDMHQIGEDSVVLAETKPVAWYGGGVSWARHPVMPTTELICRP